MKLETFRNLYISQLQEIYSTEKQILTSLPKMAKATSNPPLRKGFEQHYDETKKQVKRLEQIFQNLGVNPRSETSKPMLGLVAEGQEIMSSQGDADVQDAALIAAAQKIEHFEIASYGTLIAYAKLLGDKASVKLLKASLEEERATDKKLTAVAESLVNRKAVRASGYDEEVVSESAGGGLSVGALLLGALAGAAVGLLLAPANGVDTRKKIVDGASSLWDQWGGKVGNLADAGSASNQNGRKAQAATANGGAQSNQ